MDLPTLFSPLFRLALLLIMLSSGLVARAQYGIDHWTVEDGLPQGIIRGIAQTPDGYLWITTLDGLVRFDGVRFTIFAKGDTPGLISNRFREMYPGRDGDLWLTNEIGGVTRYHDGAFLSYGAERGIPASVVNALTVNEAGDAWILSDNRILHWDQEIGKFVDITAPQTKVNYALLLWDIPGFWGREGAKIHCFANGRFVDYPLPPWLEHESLWGAAVDQHGALWLETSGGKQTRIDRDGTSHALKDSDHPSMSFVDTHRQSWNMRVGDHLSRNLDFLSSGKSVTIPVTRWYEDRQGNLWFGTEGDGLYHLQKQSIQVYSQEQGLADRDDYAIYQDHAGAVWIGAWHVGLSRLAAGKFTNYSRADGLPGRNVTAILEDRDHRLWIGSYGGLSIFDRGRFHKVTQPSLADGVIVQAICQDREGTLWFGTNNGLARYKDGVTTLFSAKQGLASEDVHVIIEDSSGDLWIGGYGGLTRLHHGLFTRWTEQDGLPSNTIWSIYEDSDRVLWIGTYDGGLARFKDGRFTRYTAKDGLFSNGVFQTLEDRRSNLWISCNRGIYRVSKRELNEFAAGKRTTISSVAYGKIDGMLNVECNGGVWPAGTRTRDGKLWFPTLDGAAVIDPESIVSDSQPPPVIIESALLDRVPIPVTAPLRIRPGQENLEIQYTAPAFIKPAQINFKYQLAGQESQWVDAGSRRTAYYSHLPAGNYTFRVIAATSDGIWNLKGATLAVVVLAPFYETWWFASLLLVLAAAGTAVGWNYRVAQLKRASAAQQAFSQQLIASQENERRRIAAELHDSLGQRLVVINNLALFALRSKGKGSQDGGEGQMVDATAVEEISAETKLAIQETREISYNLRPFQLDRLGLNKAIEAMIRTVAKSAGINISTKLDDIDDLFPEELRINFYRIVQEGLNNIVKHSGASQVNVSIQRTSERMVLTIQDDGRGFAAGGRPAQAGQNGFGLTGMAERANLLGGQLQVQSESGRGTVMTVAIPKNQ
jgi:signal transduction histidine kinase/ligand-binding sensor domain-containing protein